MPQFTLNGVIYEELPNGQVRVVGYQQGAQPSTVVAPNPQRTAQQARDEARADASSGRDEIRTGLAIDDKNRQRGQDAFNNTQKLKNDFDALPEVKAYRQAITALGTGLKTGNTPQGDLALIYAYAKMMDPNSVVREGEAASVANADTIAGQIAARLKKELEGTGTFSPEARANLREEMIAKAQDYNFAYRAARTRFSEDAKAFGVDPQRVVGPHSGEPYLKEIQGYLESQNRKKNPVGINLDGTIPGGNGGGPAPRGFASGNRYSTQEDFALAQAVQEAYNRGGTPEDMFAAARARGYEPNEADVKGWTAAVQYRDNPRRRGPLPSVEPRQSGVRTSLFGVRPGDAGATTPGAAMIGAANAYSLGGLDEIAGAVNSAFSGRSMGDETAWANLAKQSVANANPGSYAGGELLGGITQGAMGARALAEFPKLAAAFNSTKGLVGAGAGYGAVQGGLENNDNRAMGAGVGALAGAGGSLLGIGAGNVAERLMRTQAGQGLSNASRSAFNAVVPDRFRINPTGNVPNLSSAERLIPHTDKINGAISNLRDAADLNLPYALADAAPELRNLAGSASRLSPDGRALAESVLEPRALGQADRAREGVNTLLAQVGDPRRRYEEVLSEGKSVYGPLYDQAYAAPPITSPRLEMALNTPAGRQATAKANTIAANEFRDPKAMGFAVDEAGNPVLNGFPVAAMDRMDAARSGFDAANSAYEAALRKQQASLTPGMFAKEVQDAERALASANAELASAKAGFSAAPRSGTIQDKRAYTTQSLDYVKRGIDDILEPLRNPITGKLNLDEGGRAVAGVKQSLLGEIDNLNPAYKDARDAYGFYAKRAEGMGTGKDLFNNSLPDRDFQAILERTQQYDANLPEQFTDQTVMPELQRGYATGMADRIEQSRLSANPYEAIYGSPNQQQRVASLFPEGASRFDRQYGLEKDMAKTVREAIGGSPTATRQASDASFAGDLSTALVDAGSQAVTGGGLNAGSLARGALRLLGDKAKFGIGKQAEAKAGEVAKVLFNTNPRAVLDYVDNLAQRQLEDQFRKKTFRKRGGLFGAVTVPVLTSSYLSGQ